MILASDVVYWECLFEPLLYTMRTLMRPAENGRPATTLYMSQHRRRKQDKRFSIMARKYFDVQEVFSVKSDQLKSNICVTKFQLKPGKGIALPSPIVNIPEQNCL